MAACSQIASVAVSRRRRRAICSLALSMNGWIPGRFEACNSLRKSIHSCTGASHHGGSTSAGHSLLNAMTANLACRHVGCKRPVVGLLAAVPAGRSDRAGRSGRRGQDAAMPPCVLGKLFLERRVGPFAEKSCPVLAVAKKNSPRLRTVDGACGRKSSATWFRYVLQTYFQALTRSYTHSLAMRRLPWSEPYR